MAMGGMAFSIILCIMIWCIWAFCISISSTMSTYKMHIHIETYEYRETQKKRLISIGCIPSLMLPERGAGLG